MAGYVVKTWDVGTKPNEEGNYVKIGGRAPGLWSWFLSLIKIDPTISIIFTQNKVIYESGSWQGKTRRVIPINSISSFYYGYTKPWKEALVMGIVLGILTFGLGLLVGLIYYFLNKTLSIGICEKSGVMSGIDMKRSVIEGKKIDEKDAELVCSILERLVDAKNESTNNISTVESDLEGMPLLESEEAKDNNTGE